MRRQIKLLSVRNGACLASIFCLLCVLGPRSYGADAADENEVAEAVVAFDDAD